MRRLAATLGLCLALAGCAGATPGTQPPSPRPAVAQAVSSPPASSPPAPTPSGTLRPSPSPSAAPVAWPDGIVAHPAGSLDNELGYLEYLPPGYGDGPRAPLLVFLHGTDENGVGSEASLVRVLKNGVPRLIADGQWPSDRPFVVLMPQYPPSRADRCDVGEELDRFLAFAIARYDVNPARVYLTGISCGAIGIYDYLAVARASEVAAAVPISGHMRWAMEKVGCAVARVPLWVFHGALDDIVPVHFIDEQVDALRACTDPTPGELDLTIYPDADHDAWTRTYDLSAGNDVYGWLLDHTSDPPD